MAIWRMVVRISSPVLGGTGVNLWHLRDASPVDAGALQNSINAVRDFYDDIKSVFNGATTVSFDGSLTTVSGEGEPEVDAGFDSWSVAGGTTTQNLPPANCIVVSWRTSSATRSGRGRTFIGPVSEQTLEGNGTVNEANRSSILAAANDLIATSSLPGNGGIVVWSPTTGLARDIVSASVANKFGVLRSRRD